MQFRGLVAGESVSVLLDSGATDNFMSVELVHWLGLRTTDGGGTLKLPDGSEKPMTGVMCPLLRVGSYFGRVRMHVVELSGLDVVLGDPWLRQLHAFLDYGSATPCCVIRKGLKRFTLYPSLVSDSDQACNDDSPTLLSALQFKRACKGARQIYAFMLRTDPDGDAVDVGERDASHMPLSGVCDDPALQGGVRELLSEYSDRFPERLPDGLPPMRDTFHTIPLQPGAKPCFERARRCSPAQRVEMERQVKELLDLGYIVPSSSPFGCPVLFVGKKDGGLRMCIDYRALNRITIQNKWPLPRIDDLFDQLRGAKVFTALDLMSGYHQLRIHPDDEDKTAFVTPFGHYQYKVLCFGLTNAPATFQECMSRTFKDQVNKFVLVYMDDIIIYSRTAAEHLEHLRVVLQILRENQFYCKKSKCQFALPEMLYLGHTVSEKGIAVDPKKTAKVAGWLEPTTKLELQRFLGLTNYFRKFIPKYAEMVASLTNLTRKKCEWNWDTSCQHAFDKVKQALVTPPLLAFPDPQQPYQVVTDASCVGIAAVLLQNDRPVAYESRKLSPAEKNYTTTEQELLAVVHALRVWQCYLAGATFEVVTDHCPNTYLQTQPSLSRRQARWAEFLQRFGFTWTYKPGKTNIADPLSRDPAFLAQVTFREMSHSRSHMLNAIASVRALRSHSPLGKQIRGSVDRVTWVTLSAEVISGGTVANDWPFRTCWGCVNSFLMSCTTLDTAAT